MGTNITDIMQQQAMVRISRKISRKISGTNVEILQPDEVNVCVDARHENATEAVFELYKNKIIKRGTDCVMMINDHLYDGRFHSESGWQTHIRERICKDTRGMRGKARRTDKNNENQNYSRK